MVRNYENICCQDLLSYSFTHGTCDTVEDGYRVAFATSPEGTLWHLVCQEWGRHEQVKSFKMIVYDDYSLLEIGRLIRQFDPRWRRSGSHLETVTSSSLSEFIRRHLCSLLFSRASGNAETGKQFLQYRSSDQCPEHRTSTKKWEDGKTTHVRPVLIFCDRQLYTLHRDHEFCNHGDTLP